MLRQINKWRLPVWIKIIIEIICRREECYRIKTRAFMLKICLINSRGLDRLYLEGCCHNYSPIPRRVQARILNNTEEHVWMVNHKRHLAAILSIKVLVVDIKSRIFETNSTTRTSPWDIAMTLSENKIIRKNLLVSTINKKADFCQIMVQLHQITPRSKTIRGQRSSTSALVRGRRLFWIIEEQVRMTQSMKPSTHMIQKNRSN